MAKADDSPRGRRPRWGRSRLRRAIPAGLIVAALVVAGYLGLAARASSGPVSYVTATASRGDLTQTLVLNGTVSLINQATAHFPTSGVVRSVDVRVGQAVKAGQRLATLQTAPLDRSVATAAAKVNAASAALAQARAAAVATGTATPSARATSARPTTGPTAGPTNRATATATPTPSSDPTPSQPAHSPPGSDSATGSASGSPTTAAPRPQTVTTTVTRTVTVTSPASGGAAARSTAAAGTNSAANAAGTIASRQFALLDAEQALARAQQIRDGAELTAPLDGVVGSLDLTAGRTASTSAGVVVVGSGAARVTVAVPATSLALIHPKQSARVSAAGVGPSSSGTVESISPLPSSTTSTPTYPVTVIVPSAPAWLASGSQVSVGLTTASAQSAVLVPVSALSGVSAGRATVRVQAEDGSIRPVSATVGAVGGGRAALLGGVNEGDRVILADSSIPLPSNQNGLRRTPGLGGGAGIPGGQIPGGGFQGPNQRPGGQGN